MPECNNHTGNTQSADSVVTKKVNQFLSKFSYWIVGIVVAILGSIYTATVERIEAAEQKIQYLYQDKVSKEELRVVTQDINEKVDSIKYDIMQQQSAMKSDILSRLDYLLRIYPPSQSGVVNSTNK